MEDTEKLFKELQDLEGTLLKIETKEWDRVTDPETQDEVMTLITGERLLGPNDKRVKELQKHVESKIREIRGRREGYHFEHGRISKELVALTTPVIRGYVEELSDLGGRPKLSREILDQKYDGFKEKTILTVMTNEKAILAIRNLVKVGIEKVQGMGLVPVSQIREEFFELKRHIEAVDWHKMERIEGIDEAEFFKFSFPKAINMAYKGPLSGLR